MNTNVTRRALLGATALTPLALAGCNLTGGNADAAVSLAVTQTQTMISAAETTLSGLAALKNIPGLTPDVVNQTQTALTSLNSVSSALGGVTTVASAQPVVQKVETYVNAIVAALLPWPLPPPYNLVVAAMAITLPLIEAGVNMTASAIEQANAKTAAPVVQATVPPTSSAQPEHIAAAILRKYAK